MDHSNTKRVWYLDPQGTLYGLYSVNQGKIDVILNVLYFWRKSCGSFFPGNVLGLGGIRYRGENIMRLSLDRGGRTTRDYEGPQVAPRVQAALDAAMHNVEPDIEVDVSALNAKVGQAPVRGFRKHTNGHQNKKNGSKNCWKDNAGSGSGSSSQVGEAYPSSRGLVPK